MLNRINPCVAIYDFGISGYKIMEILKHKILEFTFISKTFGQLTETFHYCSLLKYRLLFKKIVIFMYSLFLINLSLTASKNAAIFSHDTVQPPHCLLQSLPHSCVLALGACCGDKEATAVSTEPLVFNGILFVHKSPCALPFTVWIAALFLCGSGIE